MRLPLQVVARLGVLTLALRETGIYRSSAILEKSTLKSQNIYLKCELRWTITICSTCSRVCLIPRQATKRSKTTRVYKHKESLTGIFITNLLVAILPFPPEAAHTDNRDSIRYILGFSGDWY